ncbi:hypothetical protein Dalk_5169 [Desulfatibacillum aliphaticivorans]|uniref:Uncharacterized protein n=1 Tax=Desulfatibacillum aliphaticivorans TaxID=218208 RepID=B8FE58_DESAL|nr:hypothetical protein [Desulfatibacillum aliphaticivorans]ACL06839.1 hypothetical protein Dalk_5169 [Desulfatibacillum aliphaticivorans]
MKPQYSIICHGEVLPEKTPLKTQKDLTPLFGRRASQLLASLNGGRPYIRKDLSLEQALKLKADFDEAGLKVAAVRTYKCPCCGHVQSIDGSCEKCVVVDLDLEIAQDLQKKNHPESSQASWKEVELETGPEPPESDLSSPFSGLIFSKKDLEPDGVYSLVFTGEIQQGFERDSVRQSLTQEFKAEFFKVSAPLVKGSDYIINGLSGLEAQALRERFESAGALVDIF